MAKVKFTNNNAAFSVQLRKRVEEYFKTRGILLTGNRKLYFKTAILLAAATVLYSMIVLTLIPIWIKAVLCILLGLNLAAIGFNVMHDGAHGSYSKKKWVNDLMAYSLNLLGGSAFIWKIKHNINHHSFTNIDGIDDDIDIRPWMRISPKQDKKWFHRFQHIYWPFFYGLSYITWVFMKDFQKYFSGKISDTPYRMKNKSEHVIFWFSKLAHVFLFIALPAILLGAMNAIIGYLILSLSCGLILATTFQLAHVVEGTSFSSVPDENASMEQDWTVHQIATTANFATKSRFVSWFAGGLNFQVEHHLFPRISHVHYPALSRIVKEVCNDFQIQYLENRTVFSAIRSHVNYLREVGHQN